MENKRTKQKHFCYQTVLKGVETFSVTEADAKTLGFTPTPDTHYRVDGIANVYNITDLDGDVVLPNTFKKDLAKNNARTILFSHDRKLPIGKGLFTETEKDLRVTLFLAKGITQVNDIYHQLKMDLLSFSIGFIVKQGKEIRKTIKGKDTYIFEISEGALFECSLVTFPANTESVVTSVKQRKNRNNNDEVNKMSDEKLNDAVKALKDHHKEMSTHAKKRSKVVDRLKKNGDEATKLHDDLQDLDKEHLELHAKTKELEDELFALCKKGKAPDSSDEDDDEDDDDDDDDDKDKKDMNVSLTQKQYDVLKDLQLI